MCQGYPVDTAVQASPALQELAGNKQVQPCGRCWDRPCGGSRKGGGALGSGEKMHRDWRKVRHFLFGAERWEERGVRPWDFGHDSHARCGSTGQPAGAGSLQRGLWAPRPAREALGSLLTPALWRAQAGVSQSSRGPIEIRGGRGILEGSHRKGKLEAPRPVPQEFERERKAGAVPLREHHSGRAGSQLRGWRGARDRREH